MGIEWGSWKDSGGNGMRVGIDVQWEEVTHSETGASADVKIYTQNRYSYSDGQKLSYGGNISGSFDFTNSHGNEEKFRDEKGYTYDYASDEYGSSPRSKTFTASLSGAFNGVTPSVSVSSPVPGRPYADPYAPGSPGVGRISDTAQQISWTDQETAGRPWTGVRVERSDNGGGWFYRATADENANSYTDATGGNVRYQYRLQARGYVNGIGDYTYSGYVYTGYVWTSPNTPTSCNRSGGNGTNQTVQWANQAGYGEYVTEVWRAANGSYSRVADIGAGTQSWEDAYPASNPSIKFKYCVRHRCTGQTLYSGFSNETSETTGQLLVPNAPTNLTPTATVINPTLARTFIWTHNPNDTTAQTKYTVRHRVVGSPTWTTTPDTTSGVSSYALPASTYATGLSIEWQVRTWGMDTTLAGPYSTSATFTTTDPSLVGQNIRPLCINTDTNAVEAFPRGFFPPVGSMMPFGGDVAPAGWLLCDGREVSQTAYADLFAIVGTKFNTGGETTGMFRVPDMRDRVAVGASAGKAAGSKAGAASIALSETHMPSHLHFFSAGTGGISANHTHGFQIQHEANVPTGGSARKVTDVQNVTGGFGTQVDVNTGTVSSDHSHGVSGNTDSRGSNSAFSVQNPYVALHHIIKA